MNTGSQKIQSVGIPTDTNGEITRYGSIGMGFTRLGEKGEPLFIQGENSLVVKLSGELRATGTVFGIYAFVLPSSVMENGKELHHRKVGTGSVGKDASIFKNAGPVGETVAPLKGLWILSDDGVDESFGYGRHGARPFRFAFLGGYLFFRVNSVSDYTRELLLNARG